MSRDPLARMTAGRPRPALTIVRSEPLLAEAVRMSLTDAVTALAVHDPGARVGDDEAIHQMRVALRRLRSNLRTLGDAVDLGWQLIVEPPMREIAMHLGAARDFDVLVAWLRTELRDELPPDADVRQRIERERWQAHTALREALHARRYLDLRGELDAAVAFAPLGPSATMSADAALRSRVLDAWRRLDRRANRLRRRSPDADFHRARIAAKRVRYAADLTARVLPDPRASGAARMAKRVARLQGALGELQDAAVAQRVLAEAMTDTRDPAEAFAVGRLVERAAGRGTLARETFLERWPSVRRRRLRRWAGAGR